MNLDDFEWGEGWRKWGDYYHAHVGSGYVRVGPGVRATIACAYPHLGGDFEFVEVCELQARLLASMPAKEAYELLLARTSAPSG